MKHGVAPRRSLASKTLAMSLLVMLVGAWLAPVAHAQVGGIGVPVGGLFDPISGGTAPDGTVGAITDPISGGTAPVSPLDTGTGTTPITEPVGGVVDTVGDTKDKVEGTADDPGGSLGQVGSGAGGTIDTVTDTVDRTSGGLTGSGGHRKKEGERSPNDRTDSTSLSSVGTGTEVLGESLADALRADGLILAAAKAAAKAESTGYAATGSSSTDQSFITQIGRVAAEAVQQAAFPIALILMVAAFLMVQNRIDSKDPKLALAPADSEHDLLSFT